MSKVVLFIIVANVLFSLKGFNDQLFFNKNKFQIGAIKNGEYLRMLTSGFLHVDPKHLLFNMITLYFFGDNVVNILGLWKFLLIYFGSLIFGGLFSLSYHKDDLYYSAVGASGAVMGVIYAAIMLYPDMALGFIFFPFFDIPGYIFGLGYLLYSIYGMKNSVGNIGHSAHLGGAIGGFALTLLLFPDVLSQNTKMVIILGIPILLLFIFEKKLSKN
ncbi:rhomboid family intramembrane serine protease [Urechidicola croceus]|uniref:Rhomboid family intramembrane serine protease n=1 Tax=Urechidicola croceus TaxID=1850246 RepID=A0A1D8P5M6_9FLAO|nr:rhomboid family intramembrane serine protease [Urechidicola croceus]AOW19889.1 rhomboid family intramembrane serine protease [Urechidicola croceus]